MGRTNVRWSRILLLVIGILSVAFLLQLRFAGSPILRVCLLER